jgi:uncharacterized protein (TIGR02466 family)
MSVLERLFVTTIHRDELGGVAMKRLTAELAAAVRLFAKEDEAGRRWCAENGYPGYTSYASLDDLTRRAPAFAALEGVLDPRVAAFAEAVDLDLGRRRLRLDSVWVNKLGKGGYHSAHIHPNAVVSGTYYVEVPAGAGAIRFEDPRLPLFMAAPPRKATSRRANRTFVRIEPKAGTLLLWESWLRHEVEAGRAPGERISVSFNYALG